MKTIIISGEKRVEIIEQEMPVRKKGEALLKMVVGGICGSDLSTYRGKQAYATFPVIPGHEIAAEIVDIDENARGLKPGMLVTVNPYFNCGKCYSCRHGKVNCCENNQTMGVQRDGAFSEYFVVPAERVIDGKGLTAERLALVEPFCIGYHGVKRADIQKDEKVLIIGAGTIGLCAAVSANIRGAEVYMADVSEEKLKYASDHFQINGTILNDHKGAIVEAVETCTGGDGFDVTVEAVGLNSTFMDCIDGLAFGGKIIQVGVGKNNVDFPFLMIQKKEMNIYGSRNALTEDFDEAIQMISDGTIDMDALITNEYSYEEAAEAFAHFDKNPNAIKTLLKW
ncbi:MAG: zinc-binding alcohol dehydrogenase family protein [Ruminococcus sp.]|nr:zinc-binding alcohol dehydrogenase family protein [Ruminococcus sp.]